MPQLIFAGYLVNLGDIYVWLRWLQYLSVLRYSTEAILRNEFEDNTRYAEEFRNTYENFDYDIGLLPCILILLGLAVVLRCLAGVLLKVTVARVQ